MACPLVCWENRWRASVFAFFQTRPLYASQTHQEAQSVLQTGNSPASAAQVLGLHTCMIKSESFQ